MKKIIILTVLAEIFATVDAAKPADSLYHERYRPQYHFTPAHRWIGDPCGNVLHNRSYRAYSWGAYESPDLVHWTEHNDHAIKNVPEGIATFTGSVVVDSAGTAGYGDGAYVAAFTSFDKESKKQSQSIAHSHDGGRTFMYYDLNPVLDIWSTEFRDPTVIPWPADSTWVMVVAKALEKKVGIYRSPDLKQWTWASDFGPMGDVEKSWECPDLFQLPLDGDTSRMKWIMLVSVNWAREQYFVGDFDGRTFTPDSSYTYKMPVYVDDGLDYYASRVFQDYDHVPGTSPVYTMGWVNTWDYAQQAPTTYGKGIWSLPREYTLVSTPSGPRLRQKPAAALETLRGKAIRRDLRLRTGVTPLPFIAPLENVYELEADFDVEGTEPFGLWLCEGEGRRVNISYDPASGYLTLDRSNTTDATIPSFERVSHVKTGAPDNRLRLHIFVDKSTIEIFVNNGGHTLTALTYASPGQTSASLWSLNTATRAHLTVYPLKPSVGHQAQTEALPVGF